MPALASGAGLGFRRELIAALKAGVPEAIRFFELAPENWAGMGGRSARDLRHFTERYPFVCHGLSLVARRPARRSTRRCSHASSSFMAEHGMTPVHRTPVVVRRRRPSLRPAADPADRRSGEVGGRPHPPRAGHPRHAHRHRERLVLRRPARRRNERSRIHPRRRRAKPTACCTSTSTTSTSTAAISASTRSPSWTRCRSNAPATSTSPATTSSPTAC